MARRRLLTILAASAMLSTALTGPAVALETVAATTSTPGEAVAEVDQGTGATTDAVEEAVDDTVVEAPIAQVTDATQEAVDALSTATPSPAPTSEPEPGPVAPTDAAADTDGGTGTAVLAAGDVAGAPDSRVMAGTGGLRPLPEGRPPAAPAPVTAPPASATAPATGDVDAPLVAPPPAADAPSASMLALPATTPLLPDGDSPALALVAAASLLAAGAWTVREARAAATCTPTVAPTATA